MCENPYASIAMVALDDRPLRESTRILVQIGTTIRPTGWKEHAEDFEVDPAANGTVSVRNRGLTKAARLEPDLDAGRPATAEQADGAFVLSLPPDALYVIVER